MNPDALAGSQFVALVVTIVGIVGLFRLYVRALDRQDKTLSEIGPLTKAVSDNASVTNRVLDLLVTFLGSRGRE